MPARDFKRPLFWVWVSIAYWGILYGLGGLSQDHFLLCGFSLWLFYWRPSTRHLFYFLFPMVLSAVLYDSMRYYADYIRGPIHVTEPYIAEKFLFGFAYGVDGAIQTPNEFWQRHTYPVLDFFAGGAYLVFIFEYILLCFFFYFTNLWGYLRRASWSFFWVNLMGYSTYYWYAAAPPWYVADHGMGPAKMDTAASPAGAARFDELLGTEFFTGMYSKSADVFGAIPSLHVTYPFLAMIFCFQMRRFRGFSTFFFVLMCFAAVYLNHHYIIDVLIGLLYAAITLFGVENYYRKRTIDPNRMI